MTRPTFACLPPGTLLSSRSRILPSSVAAIKAALAKGVQVGLEPYYLYQIVYQTAVHCNSRLWDVA